MTMVPQDLSPATIARCMAAMEGRSFTNQDDWALARVAHRHIAELPEQTAEEQQRAHDAAAELFSRWWPDGRVVDEFGRPVKPRLA